MKKKRVLAALLCGAMALGLLAGCGSSAGGGDSAGGTEAAGGSSDSGDYPTVVMAMMNFSGSPAGIERISGLIGDYTKEKYGVDFELEIMDAASYKQEMQLMLSSGEQVDIFNAITLGYTACVNNGYTLDLEEDDLIATHGQGIIDTMGQEYIDACRVGGKLYGLPQNKDNAAGLYGIAIGAEYLDAIGYDYKSMYANEEDEIIYTDLDTINDIYAQLHEQYPDKYVMAPQEATLSQGPLVDNLGGDFFGVLVDPANNLEVVDMFQTDEFRELCDTYYAWNQAGYISKDALTDDTAATSAVKAGTALSYATATKPGIKQQESNLCGREMIIFQYGEEFMKSSALSGMPWCINSNTEDPEAAMKVLNGFYTDPYLSNLLCWGEEGKEYQKTEDGHITFAEGVTAENSEYYNNVNWETPNQFIAEIWEGDDLEIWDKMVEFNNNAVTSKALGFSFDNGDVASEYTALTNVFNEYSKALCYGFTEPESGIAEFEEKLKAAGLEEYIAAKQAALDEWAAQK